jgi:hypothetical protein
MAGIPMMRMLFAGSWVSLLLQQAYRPLVAALAQYGWMM